MTLEEAVKLAQNGVKVTHRYFSPTEYMTMQGNMVIFEDGVKIFLHDWVGGNEFLLDGWTRFIE